jgi:hypothetical protein
LPGLSLALVGSFFLCRVSGRLVAVFEDAETEAGAIESAPGKASALSADGDIDQTIFID